MRLKYRRGISVGMKIGQWIEFEGLTTVAAGRRIGKPQSLVSRFLRGLRRPSFDTMEVIAIASGGAVMPNDWLSDEALARIAAAQAAAHAPALEAAE